MSQKHRERQALIVIDVQEGFEDTTFWGMSSNPDCEQNIAVLLSEWKTHDLPIIVVRHDSQSPTSPLHPDQPGNRLMSFVSETVPDLLVTKHVNSAFYGDPGLHEWLQKQDINRLVICGIQTNMCVETTARMAGNLGYDVTVALDATRTFDLATTIPGLGTITHTADELMKVTALNLQAGGFARISATKEITATMS
ncbi:cysteine hydrolase family protein [Cryobacterium aureum]|uniref:cysteine hydrolase family protein n=1 Tax=Cryobacterium aureum TaxID=995037 RepID=UPI000CF53D84|nr:cysteine hydrolase family protein [Cryobacterium aureum]